MAVLLKTIVPHTYSLIKSDRLNVETEQLLTLITRDVIGPRLLQCAFEIPLKTTSSLDTS